MSPETSRKAYDGLLPDQFKLERMLRDELCPTTEDIEEAYQQGEIDLTHNNALIGLLRHNKFWQGTQPNKSPGWNIFTRRKQAEGVKLTEPVRELIQTLLSVQLRAWENRAQNPRDFEKSLRWGFTHFPHGNVILSGAVELGSLDMLSAKIAGQLDMRDSQFLKLNLDGARVKRLELSGARAKEICLRWIEADEGDIIMKNTVADKADLGKASARTISLKEARIGDLSIECMRVDLLDVAGLEFDEITFFETDAREIIGEEALNNHGLSDE